MSPGSDTGCQVVLVILLYARKCSTLRLPNWGCFTTELGNSEQQAGVLVSEL